MISNIDKLVDWFILVNWSNILTILIGPIGIILGIFINEYFKRKNRSSLFSEEIFRRKLDIYEKLYYKMREAYNFAHEIIEDKNLSKYERKKRWTNVVIPIMEYLDQNALYIDGNIRLHCSITLVGVEELADLPPNEKKTQTKEYFTNWQQTSRLIREDCGLKRLDKFFSKINKPDITSDYIEYAHKRKKEMDKKDS